MVAYAKKKVEPQPRLTPQEYLERERKAETKSEYHDGVIVAMAGASPEHNTITFNLNGLLYPQLLGGNCQGFGSDQRVYIPACNRYVYPDLIVVCGEPQYQEVAGLRSLLNPTLVIEVLSESTAKADREEKFDGYDTLESLTTYVLVAQDRARLEAFTRQSDGSWRYDVARGLEAILSLSQVGVTLRLAEIYAHVPFPAEAQESSTQLPAE